mgnify:CR=1 FL=1
MKRININGKSVETDKNTVFDVLFDTDKDLARSSVACKINGKTSELTTTVNDGDIIEPLGTDTADGRKIFWHTASHVLAQAVKNLYPEAKLAIGPAIDSGFYYDFDIDTPFNSDDLKKITAEMKRLVKERYKMERIEVSPDKAREIMKDEPYKLELIDEHAGKGETITLYRQGNFTDLCAGPHLFDISKIKAIALLSSTGAYWRGDSKNKALQRIYGIAFPKASELEEHLHMLEEAKKRDHNKIGRELEYFTTSDVIGQGLPILLPKGAKVIQILQRFVEDEEYKRGYLLTKTPLMAKSDLYKISGHWGHYKEGMFVLGDEEKDKEVFALRPMTCPFQYQVFLNRMRSYRDLPMRLGETSTLFRNEDSGEMHGLIRVRQFTISEGHLIVQFTISEGHLICTPEQLEQEFKGCLELAQYMLRCVGLADDISYRFSQWDPNDREKYIGTEEQWNEAQGMMYNILDHLGIKYSIGVGEAAFYGPKLDIQIKNVYGKEDTLITIQIDQMLAAQFGMEYVDKDGIKKTPCIIHRTAIGCYERTLALVLEKFAGALPTWMAPVQATVMPISDAQANRAKEVCDKLFAAGLRVNADYRNEKIGYKIREAQMQKTPFMLIIGDKELQNGTVAVRSRKDGDLGSMSIDEFVAYITKIINEHN